MPSTARKELEKPAKPQRNNESTKSPACTYPLLGRPSYRRLHCAIEKPFPPLFTDAVGRQFVPGATTDFDLISPQKSSFQGRPKSPSTPLGGTCFALISAENHCQTATAIPPQSLCQQTRRHS